MIMMQKPQLYSKYISCKDKQQAIRLNLLSDHLGLALLVTKYCCSFIPLLSSLSLPSLPTLQSVSVGSVSLKNNFVES